ncbi:GDSL-type esterase/lipase family protein [Luteolibacter sp. Populi]|uniref:GDSL-type esterase/lipase family protein n=1 Tax=Luteolibacter sp. Populi TaxID=3230487 RepID=UPI0034666557
MIALPRKLLVAALACLAYASAAPPMRILPIGDSITQGSPSSNYRPALRTILTNAGYEVDYVGTNTVEPGNLTDREHEGHGGWRIDQLDSNVAGWFSAIEDPDFILLHIGTNDFGQGFNTTTAIDRWDALILKMATLRPHANIVATNIMQRSGGLDAQIQTQFNATVQQRVDAHIAAGRKVTFLDMRAAVPLSDMPDGLHPNQVGSDKMAAAWLGRIQALSTPEGDFSDPAVARVRGSVSRTEVTVTFSKPVADSAGDLSNYAIDGGVTISSATLDATKRKVTLVTSPHTDNTIYTVTVNNIVDRQTPTPNAIEPDSTKTFTPPIPRGYQSKVAESEQYALAYSLDIPMNPAYRQFQPAYQVDNRSTLGGFDRVAYYVELQSENGDLQYVWTSMDAFTQDAGKIAVPTVGSGAFFQQAVTNLNVISNVAGLTTGSSPAGNIEFWPGNYQKGNSAGVTGASGELYDFGDQPTQGDYGSMQVHNTAAAQTVFAFNNWGTHLTTKIADLGIGNDPFPVTEGKDWTFHNNAGAYSIRSLQVLVRSTGDHVAPAVVSAIAAAGRSQVVVNFSESLASASVNAAGFTLNNGVTVLSATLSADRRTVTLQTTLQPQATPLTLSIGEVRDSSANANPIAAGTTAAVSTNTIPAEITANIGGAAAGYELVYSSDLPVVGNFSAGNPYKYDDRAAAGNFTKVAYYLELQQQGQPTRYVWASMDSFTGGRNHIGIPLAATGAILQQNVTNLNVISNAPGVVNGTTATGGNIEFWPHSYNAVDTLVIPNASGSNFDTGDNRLTGTYGSMQVHNHDAGANQTVFAVNHFGVNGSVLDIGMGNNPAPVDAGVDWTFAANAGSYSKRTLHVLVLPGVTTNADLVTKVPEAAGYQLAYSLNIPATGNLRSGNGFAPYQVNYAGALGPFNRVAYYMELQKTGDAGPSYVWTSMDAFTQDATRIGVPSGLIFQQQVTNLNVVSNVAGVVNGTNLATGNIEFWSGSYNANNALGIPNANNSNYDWGDGGGSAGNGHGSMQIHNHGASQTILALNNWGSPNNASNPLCIGIGNGPLVASPDWTFANNASTYDVKRVLQVYVLPGNSDVTAPSISALRPSVDGDAVRLTFSEPISQNAPSVANVSIAGLTVTGIEFQGTSDLIVRTSAQVPGNVYTVNVSGVSDRSPVANTVPRTANFTAYTPPAVFANIPEIAGYRHVLSLNLPGPVPNYNNNGINYDLDERKFGDLGFDRVAYLMELNGNWAYASFDRHTHLPSQIGVPVLTTNPVPIQQLVTHMNVASNVAGVVNGSDIATGNIEFWGGNYDGINERNILGASPTLFDFGDRMTNGGHGSMQIHNYGAAQTIMGFNNWGSNTTENSEMGIGNNTAQAAGHTDWTFANNGLSYTTKRLYVLVREGNPSGPAAQFYAEPGNRIADVGEDVTFTVSVAGPGPYTYQWRHNGLNIVGATQPWLDLGAIDGADSGSYDVIVTDPGLVATTSPAGSLIVTGLPLEPTEITINGGDSVALVFHGDPGRSYQIQRSGVLEDWQVLETITAPASGDIPYLDEDPLGLAGYYRAVPQP